MKNRCIGLALVTLLVGAGLSWAQSLPSSGLIQNLAADAINTSDSSQVRQSGSDYYVKNWVDSSGSGNNAWQTTDAAQPLYVASAINGKPALLFDGVDDLLNYATGARCYPTGAVFMVMRTMTINGNTEAGGFWSTGYNGSDPDLRFAASGYAALYTTPGGYVYQGNAYGDLTAGYRLLEFDVQNGANGLMYKTAFWLRSPPQ